MTNEGRMIRAWRVLAVWVPALAACLRGAPDRGARVREACLALGGLWPKVGQTCSFRYDLFPVDICDALSALQGTDGQASVGVVRRVGDRAVKTVLPGMAAQAAADFAVLRLIARVVGWWPVVRRARLREMVAQLDTTFTRELDLRYEGALQAAMRTQLHGRHGLYVPKVYAVTADRLEMEYIEGRDLSEVLRRPVGRRARRHARRLLFALLRMIWEDNRFHGDLHPGNVRVMPDGRLALLDFGVVGITEGDFLRHFRRFLQALDTQDWRWAAKQFLYLQRDFVPRTTVGRALKARTLARVEDQLTRVIAQWAFATSVPQLPFHVRSLNALTQRMVAVTARAGAHLNAAWLAIQRALQALERILAVCWPDVDYLRVARQYLREAQCRQPSAWMTQLQDVLEMASDYLDTLTNQGVQIAV